LHFLASLLNILQDDEGGVDVVTKDQRHPDEETLAVLTVPVVVRK
jgi:hypothetical protein